MRIADLPPPPQPARPASPARRTAAATRLTCGPRPATRRLLGPRGRAGCPRPGSSPRRCSSGDRCRETVPSNSVRDPHGASSDRRLRCLPGPPGSAPRPDPPADRSGARGSRSGPSPRRLLRRRRPGEARSGGRSWRRRGRSGGRVSRACALRSCRRPRPRLCPRRGRLPRRRRFSAAVSLRRGGGSCCPRRDRRDERSTAPSSASQIPAGPASTRLVAAAAAECKGIRS